MRSFYSWFSLSFSSYYFLICCWVVPTSGIALCFLSTSLYWLCLRNLYFWTFSPFSAVPGGFYRNPLTSFFFTLRLSLRFSVLEFSLSYSTFLVRLLALLNVFFAFGEASSLHEELLRPLELRADLAPSRNFFIWPGVFRSSLLPFFWRWSWVDPVDNRLVSDLVK